VESILNAQENRMNKIGENIGSKRPVVGAHYGFKDWLLQRITAVIMAIYTVVLLAGLLCIERTYEGWAGFITYPAMRWFTLLALLSLMYHAWIGARDIVMDYIKPVWIRLSLYTLLILWLAACALYSVQVLFQV